MVRIKHRYLLLNILYPNTEQPTTPGLAIEEAANYTVQFRKPSSDRLDARLLARMIRDGVSDLFGDYGAGMVAGSLQVKYLSPATSTAIVRVARAHYRLVWAALSFVTKIPKPVDQVCVIQVVRTSGTIKKSEEEAIRRARLIIVRAQRAKTGTRGDTGPDQEVNEWDLGHGIDDSEAPDDSDEDDNG